MKFDKLGDLAVLIAGQSPPSSSYNKNGIGIPFFQGKTDYGQINPTIRNWCNEPTKISIPGDILISVRAPVGPVNINNVRSCIGRGLSAIRVKENVCRDYIYYYLKLNETKISKLGVGSTFMAITQKDLREISIPLPAYPDQLRIANLLTKAENLISQRNQSIALLDEFLKSTFLEMFGDPVRNEKGWKVETIDKLCIEIVDCVNKTAPLVDYPTDYIMIRTTNVRDLKINFNDTRYVCREVFDKWTRRLLPTHGDIIFTREAPVGEAAIIDFDKSVFLGQRTMQFRPDTNVINKYFLLFQLMGSDVKQQINKLSSGSTVKHLSVPACKKFLIKVPPLDLQNQFAKIVEKTESLKVKYQSSLQELENLYGSLSQRAFRGEL